MSITEIVVLISAILIFIVVLNLVRLRRLREEYSWLWLAAAIFYLGMAIKPDLVARVSALFGISNNITAFLFISLLFIISILIHYSVRLSKLTTQMKDVAQLLAIIEADQNEHSHCPEPAITDEVKIMDHEIPQETPEWHHIVENQQTGE